MLRQSSRDFIFSTNSFGSGKATSRVCALLALGWLCICAMATVCCADGYRPDPVEYDKALRDVVAARCKDFAKLGVEIDPAKLQYGEEEVVDSFLNGRELYRTAYQSRFPVSEKLEWLKGILGDAYESRREAWAKAVADRKSGRIPRWTRERLKARMDELALMPESPVKMDDGMCRSSSGCARIDCKCIHCGWHTVYTDVDEIYRNEPPEYYKGIADELKACGLDVEVDGRAVCPDCNRLKFDFRLSMTPEVCRVKPVDDSTRGRRLQLPTLPTNVELRVIGHQKVSRTVTSFYEVQCVFPEAWVQERGNQFLVYGATNDARCLEFLADDAGLEYAEPRVTCHGRCGRLTRIVNYRCNRIDVPAEYIETLKSIRSSGLDDIPPTYFVVNGRRFEVDRFTADALLALVQGYSTFATGTFSDHYPIQQALPKLRKCLGILPSP